MTSSTPDQKTGAETIHWDLSDLYNSPEDPKLISDKDALLKEADRFSETYRGKIAECSAAEIAGALLAYEQIVQKAGKIASYAHLIWSTNTEDPALGKLLQQANELNSELSQRLVFFDVEWLKVDDEKAEQIIHSEDCRKWRHYLGVSRLYKSHTLSEDAEKVMSAKSVTGRTAWNRYFEETLGAARFELDGKKLTEQQVLSKLHDPDRELRKRAHASLTETFREHARSLTFVFNTILADKHTNDKLRNYDNWIDSRNLSNQTDRETVDALIGAVTSRYDLVQRYYNLKKQLLEVDELFDYDRYAPIVKNIRKVNWHDAKEMVLDAYGEFHPEMRTIASKFFDQKWIDAAITPGKRGGAYSASTVTSVHPYVFMNYDGQLRDVQTLAHELGHGVHQYLSRKQGELQASTPLTTAETASVFGEMLVFNKLMSQLSDQQEKLALLVNKIDDTIATVFRQISMNRFEDRIHTARREQGELTTGRFSDLWFETQQALYGDSVTLTEEYKLWWCYIPHFLHTPGYVYAYAFGELLVLALYEAYSKPRAEVPSSGNGRDGFSDRYLTLLEAGGSDWPHNLIASMNLGIDIRDASFWNRGLMLFEAMITEAEELAAGM